MTNSADIIVDYFDRSVSRDLDKFLEENCKPADAFQALLDQFADEFTADQDDLASLLSSLKDIGLDVKYGVYGETYEDYLWVEAGDDAAPSLFRTSFSLALFSVGGESYAAITRGSPQWFSVEVFLCEDTEGWGLSTTWSVGHHGDWAAGYAHSTQYEDMDGSGFAEVLNAAEDLDPEAPLPSDDERAYWVVNHDYIADGLYFMGTPCTFL